MDEKAQEGHLKGGTVGMPSAVFQRNVGRNSGQLKPLHLKKLVRKFYIHWIQYLLGKGSNNPPIRVALQKTQSEKIIVRILAT